MKLKKTGLSKPICDQHTISITQFIWYGFRSFMYMVRLLILIFTICFLKFNAFGQISSDKSNHDFGPIVNYNNDTAYFQITNNNSKTVYFLPTQPKEDYQVLCNTKTVAPGQVLTIGIIYYTEKKGRFNIEVPLYFSNSPDPFKLTVTGNIKSISPNALTICPSIENSKPLNHTVPLNIIVRDRLTNVQIKEAKVFVKQGRKEINCVPGFRSMAFQCNCQYGKIDVKAGSEGYISATVEFDFDPENNTCIIYLEKPALDTTIKKVDRKTIVKKDTVKEEISVYIPVDPQSGDFNSTGYKPNHLIFVIDVSGSMKDSTKLGYLKESIKALISILRPQDYITLITYAGQPKLVFENVNGLSKSQLFEVIDSLHAKGTSLGSEALNLAYDLARQHFIEGGNNQIFLATDGLFNGSNFDERDLYRMANREFVKNKVKLTTIAFGRNAKAKAFLAELAGKGNGQSLTIVNMPADKSVLIEEVKAQSLK